MPKIIALTFILILVASSSMIVESAFAQTISKDVPAPQWIKTYGPYAGGSLIQTSDGGYAIAGSNATHNIRGYSSFWPLLIKTDSFGEIQWINGYPSTRGFRANNVIETDDGGFILVGMGDWLLKVDSVGNIVWQKTIGLGLHDYVNLFAISSSDGNLIIAGNVSNSTTGGNDSLIAKADQDGNVLWKQIFSINSMVGPLSVFASSITETSDNGYVLVGSWDSLGGIHPWLVKTDCKGNLLINRTYSELLDLQVFRSVIAEPNGNLALTADNPSILNGNQIFVAWFLKADSSGTITKSHSYNDSRPFWILKKTSQGEYITIQETSLLNFDKSGELKYNISFASVGIPVSVVETKDGNYVVTGIAPMEDGLQNIFLAELSSSALFENIPNPGPAVAEFLSLDHRRNFYFHC